MPIIYANGCSMTYGQELNGEATHVPEEALTPSQNEHRKRHSWPGIVGSLMPGYSVFNAGAGGGSNDRIVRTTIQDVLGLNLGPDDLAIIGWTETERFEYVQAGRWVQQTVNVRPDWYGERQFVDDWARLMMNDTNRMWEKFLVQVISVQSLLQARNVPYLMFNALPAITIDNFPPIPAELWSLQHKIDHSRWITPIDKMPQCMFCQVKHLPQAPQLHPLHEGHKLWGTIVHDHISRTYPRMAQAPQGS